MLYLIGLGLNRRGFSKEALDAVSASDKIYMESYTVEFPYSKKDLAKELGVKEITLADRNFVESGEEMILESKKKDIALLVYGSPLTATTHISLIEEAKKKKAKIKIIYAASVFDAVAETGLQLYKFGKIASMPKFPAESYLDIVEANRRIKAHSLILVDIGMTSKEAVKRLADDCESKKIKPAKVVVCSRLGTKDSKIAYGSLSELENQKIKAPFCFIIPGEMHFFEKEVLENFNK